MARTLHEGAKAFSVLTESEPGFGFLFDAFSLREPVSTSLESAVTMGKAMDELNGRMIACQILITGLIARVANDSPDPLRFLTDFRDEIRAVVKGVRIAGMENTDQVRQVAQRTVDELFSLMKPPSAD
jgi:hypothetical protein